MYTIYMSNEVSVKQVARGMYVKSVVRETVYHMPREPISSVQVAVVA